MIAGCRSWIDAADLADARSPNQVFPSVPTPIPSGVPPGDRDPQPGAGQIVGRRRTDCLMAGAASFNPLKSLGHGNGAGFAHQGGQEATHEDHQGSLARSHVLFGFHCQRPRRG
jgi:hypothetical protein